MNRAGARARLRSRLIKSSLGNGSVFVVNVNVPVPLPDLILFYAKLALASFSCKIFFQRTIEEMNPIFFEDDEPFGYFREQIAIVGS
jgi:hypothetical protein